MVSEWERLHQKEQSLLNKEDTLKQEKKQVRQVKELYMDHLNGANRFWEDLQYTFHKNEDAAFYGSIRNEFTQESRKMMGHLEESEQELLREKRQVEQKVEDIYYEKKKASLEEEETDER